LRNLFVAVLFASSFSIFGAANAADGCGPGCHSAPNGGCVVDGWTALAQFITNALLGLDPVARAQLVWPGDLGPASTKSQRTGRQADACDVANDALCPTIQRHVRRARRRSAQASSARPSSRPGSAPPCQPANARVQPQQGSSARMLTPASRKLRSSPSPVGIGSSKWRDQPVCSPRARCKLLIEERCRRRPKVGNGHAGPEYACRST
jgi:hypothetical protein